MSMLRFIRTDYKLLLVYSTLNVIIGPLQYQIHVIQ